VCVALVTQHEMRVRRIVLPPVASLVLQYFFTLSHKQQDFREKVIEY